ncbi:30S ribosomal protein S18 [Candidatus Jorgensenbacteria bacterium GWA1_54_12]|uniref:Small ribosomal subunit protein bS18 n=1 Tax=Candidatus Jorgensenbacteria bacterium GWA1_54_12 TaxID=1798468 RepID=A0A1F6BLN4_9BACT|nr:MAG: 30S ribosomal protein S18 [Candidatus Jorgensenbacteria bacterium GWA1_54_12]
MRQKQCTFCSKNIQEVDFRDVGLLKQYVSAQGKIIDPRHTGVCAKHQRRLAHAIKRARHLALLPYNGI